MGLFGGGRCVEQAQGDAAVFFFLQAEVAGELLFANLMDSGRVPMSHAVTLSRSNSWVLSRKVVAAALPSCCWIWIKSRPMANSCPPSSMMRRLK